MKSIAIEVRYKQIDRSYELTECSRRNEDYTAKAVLAKVPLGGLG